MREICRLCLKSTGTFYQNLNIYKELILAIIPEYNLNLILTPLICDDCSNTLENAHMFKTMCLDSEDRITKLLQGRNGENYTLDDILNKPAVVIKQETVCGYIENDVLQDEVDPLADVENIPKIPVQINKPTSTAITKKFHCSVCNIEFLLETNFHIHLCGHAGKAFNCIVCYKGFNNEKDFTKHSTEHFNNNSDTISTVEPTTYSHTIKSTKRTRNNRRRPNTKRRRVQNGIVKTQVKNLDIGKEISNREDVNKKSLRPRSVVKSPMLENTDEDEYLDHEGKQHILNFLQSQSASEKEQAAIKTNLPETNQKQIFKCALCYVKRNTEKEITEHIKQHKPGYRKQCEICGDLFANMKGLSDHSYRQHMPTLCLVKVSDEYTTPQKTHKELKNTGRTAKRKGSKPRGTPAKMKRLQKTDNFDELVDILCEELDDLTTNSSFNCEFCEKTFKIYEALQEHMKVHFEEQNVEEPEEQDQNSSSSCDICGASFRTIGLRDKHMFAHTLYIDRKLICNFCQKRFADPVVYQSHVVLHSDDTDIFCSDCPLRFLSHTQYSSHKKYQHSTYCDGCRITFNSGDALSHHVRQCKRKFFCKYCDFEAKSKQSRQGHILIHGLPTEITSCMICDYKSLNTVELVKHIKQHNEIDDVTCLHCDKSFISQKELRIHQIKHSILENPGQKIIFKCKHCHQQFKTELKMNEHKRNCAFKPTCGICGKKCENNGRLQMHMRVHNKPRVPRFKCYLCDQIHITKLLLTEHMKNHDDVTDILCDYCQLRFYEESAYCEHVQKLHTTCSNCNTLFGDSRTLSEHMQLCPKLNMVECAHCKYKSITFVDHKRHITSEHPSTIERKYHCALCDRRFRTKRDLTWHFDQHDIVKDIRCDYCHLRFVSADHHYQHLANHTYKCQFCGVVVESKDALAEHIVKCKKNPDYIEEIIIYGKEGKLTCTHCNEVFGSMVQLKDHFKMVVLL